MDPLSVLGLVGTLAGISNAVGRNLISLINLQSKFRTSSLVVSLLVGQLTTVKAALNQIKELVEKGLAGVSLHEQLITDLSVSLDSCHVLVFVLEERIKKLEKDQHAAHGLSTRGKFGFLLEQGDLNEFTNHLNNQVNALNLLLTALYCRNTLERNQLLSDNKSRQIIRRVEDDRTSVLSLKDSASQYTRMTIATESWSLLDREFDFDQQVITTDVYRAVLRSNIMKATTTSKGKMVLRADNFLDTNPEQVEEHPEGDEKPEAGLDSQASQKQPLHKKLLDLLIKRQITEGKLLSEIEEEDYVIGQLLGSGEEETRQPQSPLKDQFKITKVISKVSKNAPGPLTIQHKSGSIKVAHSTLPRTQVKPMETINELSTPTSDSIKPLNKSQNMQLKVRSKFSNSWGSRIPRLFAFPRSQDDLKSITTLKLSPPAGRLKVLVLGISESGKSTILRSIALACNGSWNLDKLLSWKEVILTNTVQSMRVILEAMESLELPLENQSHKYHVETILMQPDPITEEHLSQEVCDAIEALWKDNGVKNCFRRAAEYQLCDNAAYNFNSVKRYSSPGYIPADLDILMAHVKTTGICATNFKFNGLEADISDVGGMRSERRKWKHAFENVDAIIYAIDIAAYDQLLCEDDTINRMQEALLLFDSVVNSRWFTQTRFLLVFTKMDKLVEKIRSSPLKKYCPDFEGGESFDHGRAYLEYRFTQLIQDPKKLFKVLYINFTDGDIIPGGKILDSLTTLLSISA